MIKYLSLKVPFKGTSSALTGWFPTWGSKGGKINAAVDFLSLFSDHVGQFYLFRPLTTKKAPIKTFSHPISNLIPQLRISD